MTIRVHKIEHGFLFGINTETGEKENLHYSKKTGEGFNVNPGSVIAVEVTKVKHQPKRIIKVIQCKN